MRFIPRIGYVACFALYLLVGISLGSAQSGFLISQIDVEGVHRIPKGTVLEYANLKVGEEITTPAMQSAIKTLYATGLFQDIKIKRAGERLIIVVTELPIIHEVIISGNKAQTTKKIRELFDKNDVVAGSVLNYAKLAQVKAALMQQYDHLGYRNVKIHDQVSLPQNGKSNVQIDIQESTPTQISQVILSGNTHYTTFRLLGIMGLRVSWWEWLLGKSHPYDQKEVELAVEKLRYYYQYSQGYMSVSIQPPIITFNKDKRQVKLVISLKEGPRYSFSGYKVQGGVNLSGAVQKKLSDMLHVGQSFSRDGLVQAQQIIGQYVRAQGFAFAQVRIVPEVDDKKATVFITFEVNEGKPILVRKVMFSGNTKTADYVLRRVVGQLEGGLYSQDSIDISQARLNNLGYLKNVHYRIEPVENHVDWVDIVFDVTESPSAAATVQFSYGQLEHFMVSLGLNESNVLGTGNALNFTLDQSRSNTQFSIHYVSPYYLRWGMSRDISLYLTRQNNGLTGVSRYKKNVEGVSYTLGLPVSEYWRVYTGLSIEANQISADESYFSTQLADYLNKYGYHYAQYTYKSGVSYSHLDRSVLPLNGLSGGVSLNVGLPFSHDSAEYYTINGNMVWYKELADFGHAHRLIFNPKLTVGYGNGYGRHAGDLPFYKHFYAGGMDTVRGYSGNSLGPKDSNSAAYGGNILTAMQLNMVVPSPSEDTMRWALFVDGGNVFDDHWSGSELRYSAGLSVQILVPLPIMIALSHPFHNQPGDSLRQFDFTVGTTF